MSQTSSGSSVSLSRARSAAETAPAASWTVAHPVEHPLPVGGPDEDHREVADLARLDQGQALEELVQRPEPARQDDERVGVLHEHRLPGEEVLELDAEVDVGVEALLVGQLDVAPDRQAATLATAAIGRLHDPGPAAGDDREAVTGQPPGDPAGQLVVRGAWLHPGRAEDRHRRPDRREGVEALDELAQDPQGAPRVAVDEGGAAGLLRPALEELLVLRLDRLAHPLGGAAAHDDPPRPTLRLGRAAGPRGPAGALAGIGFGGRLRAAAAPSRTGRGCSIVHGTSMPSQEP